MEHPIDTVRDEELPFVAIAREFIGDRHGNVPFSFLLVEAKPGAGVALHRHSYDEVVIVQEGSATWTVDGQMRIACAVDILVLRAGQPHKFTNTGAVPLRQVDIHASSDFRTEWLEEAKSVAERDSIS